MGKPVRLMHEHIKFYFRPFKANHLTFQIGEIKEADAAIDTKLYTWFCSQNPPPVSQLFAHGHSLASS